MVLCPVDFSAATPALVSCAATLAAGTQAELRLLHVLEPLPGGGLPPSEWVLEQLARCVAQARQAGTHRASTDVRSGVPAATILAEARHLAASLLVLGTHGHTHLPRFLVGSTAEEVLRKAACPTLLVSSPPAA